jgi:anti-anti-sigma factor
MTVQLSPAQPLDVFDLVPLPAAPVVVPDAVAGPPARFRVDVWTEPGQPLALVLTGELDIAAVPAITAAVTRLLPIAGGSRRTDTSGDLDLDHLGSSGYLDGSDHLDGQPVTVRLAGVTFLDCAALGALVGLRARLGSVGRSLVLTDVSAPALRLLTLTRQTHSLLPAEPAG